MGCDIHPYIEVITTCRDGEPDVYCWAEPRIWRNYTLFALMAGVRVYDDVKDLAGTAKGLPRESLSWKVLDEAFLRVNDACAGESGYCSRARAEQYRAHGDSEEPFNYWPHLPDWQERFVSHPDWHSHSWLSLDELKIVHTTMGLLALQWCNRPCLALVPIIAAMEALEQDSDVKTRLVFWFDN